MLRGDNIKTILFAILCICFISYLFMGVYSYKRESKSKGNLIFFTVCISTSLWAIGYAFMLISPNIQIANIWRIISALGWCFFNWLWICFAFSLKDTNQKDSKPIIQDLMCMTSIIFFISNLIYDPSEVVGIESYGFVDNKYITTSIGIVFSIYVAISFIIGLIILYSHVKNSRKNRVRKQMKTILFTSLVSFWLGLISDLILPLLGVNSFPFAVITISVGIVGVWYAINKHKIMSISPKFVSEYIFESVNEPIFILGEDFLVKNCNKASLNVTGRNYKELEQNPLNTIIDFRTYNFSAIMQLGNVTNVEVDLLRKDKEILVCELSATVIYDEYKDILGIVILLHDVSERKNIAEIQKKMIMENKRLLQQILEYDRLKTEFFSNISHEFRTPLNIILSAIQLMNLIHNDSKDNYSNFIKTFEKYIYIMKQNSYRLLKLINNIIDITKFDSGFCEINFNNHNIVEVVEDITLSIADFIKSKEIELIFDTDFEEKIIACDDEKIERIMLNLLSNAIKYTKPGGNIKVQIKDMDTNVGISVKDTGIGIPKDKLNVIFERFRQVDELLTRRAEGSGIGLSLVKSLVESQGGTIKASSTYGFGSEFVIVFPCRTLKNVETVPTLIETMRKEDQLEKKVERISIEFSDIYK